jgi:hypothetical protein
MKRSKTEWAFVKMHSTFDSAGRGEVHPDTDHSIAHPPEIALADHHATVPQKAVHAPEPSPAPLHSVSCDGDLHVRVWYLCNGRIRQRWWYVRRSDCFIRSSTPAHQHASGETIDSVRNEQEKVHPKQRDEATSGKKNP